MSSAAREPSPPLSGDDLPVYDGGRFEVHEANPSPGLGPERDILVALSEQQAQRAEDQFLTAIEGWLDRFQGRITATVNGPRARKGTKWWAKTSTAEDKAALVATVETKTRALDAPYIVPDKLVGEARAALRPVALRVALDAGYDTAARLGVSVADQRGDGMFAVDQLGLEKAVDQAVAQILGTIEGYAQEVRKEIVKADSSAESLDEVLDLIEAAHKRGGNWVRMAGRTLANALRNEAAWKTAQALGVTHMQWLSKRDDRVRKTHRAVDGTVRRIDDEFLVGSWRLRFPGDPTDLPASWAEIAGCRCGLLFREPDKRTTEAVRLLNAQQAGADPRAVRRLLAAAADAPELLAPPESPPGAASQVVTTEPLVVYRALDAIINAVPGQWLAWGGALALGLAAPGTFSAASPVLAVAIPSGTTVTVVGGAIVLAQGTPLEIVGTTPEATQARLV